jgi:opacity protein-like surface antigen
MFHKKYLLLAGLMIMMAQSLFAQESQPQDPKAASAPPATSMQWSNRDMTYRGKNYDVLDSSYYPKFRRKQFKRYMDHQEIFPPKPRNQWEAGVGLGLYNVIGNVPTLMLWQKGGSGFNVNVRKSLGYIFSLRAQYIYGVAKNLDRQATTSFDAPYTKFGYVPRYYETPGNPATPVYRASRMEASQLSLDLMFNAYNINFHKARNSVSFFGFFGLGGLAYKTRINALDANYQPYNFGTIVKDPNAKYNTIRKELQSKMDQSYESVADNGGGSKILDKKTLDFAPSIGAGVQYKFNKKVNIQFEDRYTFPSDVYLDGSRFGKSLGNTVSQGRSSEAVNYFSVSLNFNIQTQKKSVEPLYWINPLDHAYSELSYPRHMILPNPVLPDEDGDGITDQFDKCPKTPKGVAVDSHGCPLDTDNDGVPDYKDKQRITPTECQPVDADGVGKCPCPESCKDLVDGNTNGGAHPCGKIGAGTLLFTEKTHISTGMEAQLATLAAQMQANPNCKVVIMGGGSGSKPKEQRSWEHVNAVIEYISDKHQIGRDRFIFRYGEVGDENIVTYRGANADESGPNNVPPPHPEIKDDHK